MTATRAWDTSRATWKMAHELGVRVCLTGCGAPGTWGTLLCLRRHDGVEDLSVSVFGVDINPDASGRWQCDDFATISPPDDPVYGDKLLKLCHKRKVTVVLPQCTDELAHLAAVREMFGAWGIVVAVSDPEAIAQANDKAKVLVAAARCNVRVPHWGELPNGGIVRPCVGHGSKGIQRLEGRVVVTEYLPGPEYTVDGFTGKAGSVAVVRKRLAMRTGISTHTEVIRHEQLETWSVKLAQHLGLRYAWGFQFKEDADGVPRLLECNPRIQGTMVASMHAGVNIPWLCVREATHPVEHLPEPSTGRYVRYWSGQWFAS